MSLATQTTYTADDLLTMPDGDRYELVNGQLVERNMGTESSWIAGRIFFNISRFLEEQSLGWAFPEGTGFQCFREDRDRVRKPDMAFVRHGKFSGKSLPKGFARIPPDLAVEVVSPNDLYYEVEQKVREYLQAGVSLVWIINPDDRTVRIFRSSGAGPTQLGENDELTGEDILPGFRCQVSELFPPTFPESEPDTLPTAE